MSRATHNSGMNERQWLHSRHHLLDRRWGESPPKNIIPLPMAYAWYSVDRKINPLFNMFFEVLQLQARQKCLPFGRGLHRKTFISVFLEPTQMVQYLLPNLFGFRNHFREVAPRSSFATLGWIDLRFPTRGSLVFAVSFFLSRQPEGLCVCYDYFPNTTFTHGNPDSTFGPFDYAHILHQFLTPCKT